jgi:5-oxopent-3-ene-1,2,5-tricarboxylate decarboxylase/2-hydroxyhepta-2,4-diene-1,7-dioate isomerase
VKIARWAAEGRIHDGCLIENKLVSTDDSIYDIDNVVWLPPSYPRKIIGIALNFADHAAELNLAKPDLPAIFLKPTTSLIGHNGTVLMPPGSEYMHYEVELVAIIGQKCRHVKAEDALDFVAGYTIGNDVTVRDHIGPYFRPPLIGKGWDTFGPCGPWMVTPDEFGDPANVEVRTFVNNELRQKGNTNDMIFSLNEMIEYCSMIMTLEPGDQIWTGTPKGLSHVYPGDIMRVEIDGIGALENKVAVGPELVCNIHRRAH